MVTSRYLPDINFGITLHLWFGNDFPKVSQDLIVDEKIDFGKIGANSDDYSYQSKIIWNFKLNV